MNEVYRFQDLSAAMKDVRSRIGVETPYELPLTKVTERQDER